MELFYKYGFLQEFNPFEPFHIIQRIGPILHDSKNWTFFLHDSKNLINSFQCHSKKWTFFSNWLKELNSFQFHSKNWTFFFFDCDSKIWTLLKKITQRIESSSSWLKELNPFFKRLNENLNFFPKNWYLFCWMWPKELNHRWKMLRIDPFLHVWLRIQPFLTMEPFFIWLEELNIFRYDSEELNSFWNMTLQELNPFYRTFSYHSTNWTHFTMTLRIELFWMHDSKNLKLTQSIEPLFQFDAQNWTSLFSNMTRRIFEYDSQNWTPFSFFLMTHRIEHLFLQMTHRIDFF